MEKILLPTSIKWKRVGKDFKSEDNTELCFYLRASTLHNSEQFYDLTYSTIPEFASIKTVRDGTWSNITLAKLRCDHLNTAYLLNKHFDRAEALKERLKEYDILTGAD